MQPTISEYFTVFRAVILPAIENLVQDFQRIQLETGDAPSVLSE